MIGLGWVSGSAVSASASVARTESVAVAVTVSHIVSRGAVYACAVRGWRPNVWDWCCDAIRYMYVCVCVCVCVPNVPIAHLFSCVLKRFHCARWCRVLKRSAGLLFLNEGMWWPEDAAAPTLEARTKQILSDGFSEWVQTPAATSRNVYGTYTPLGPPDCFLAQTFDRRLIFHSC